MPNDVRKRLTAAGAKLAKARTATEAALHTAADLAAEAIAAGISEHETARLLGVNRMTVRAWLGK